MGVSTRHMRQRRQTSFTLSAGLAALLISALPARPHNGPHITQALAPLSSNLVTYTHQVAVGEEQLSLSARFTKSSKNMIQSLDWKVLNGAGETLFKGSAQTLTLPLKPGTYKIEAAYGDAHVTESVELEPQTSLRALLVMPAGALRIAPHLGFANAPALPVLSRVYALHGGDLERLVLTTDTSGDTLKLPAGEYRIETHLGLGNAVASTTIEVLPGLLRSIDMTLAAGTVHLGLPHEATSASWTITSATGEEYRADGTSIDLALTAGAYVAEAQTSTGTFKRPFTVLAETHQDLNLE